MTLYQLEVFLAVVRAGSFTKAGELLHASQSGVSHTISDLEEELGVTLFARSRNGVRLTETGEQIAAHAREIFDHTEQIHQVAAEAKGVQSGRVRIGADPLVAVLPATHPLSKQEAISIEQLEHEPFLLLTSGCENLVRGAFQERALSLNTQFEVAENPTLIAMVDAGFGVTIVPSMILPVNPEKVVVKPLKPPIMRDIGFAVRSQQTLPPVVATFIKETQRWLAKSS
jgi:DNA-binding transcriptional LysR family regulator